MSSIEEELLEHVSIIPATASFPEKFDRCGDAKCPSPCKGRLYHCSLCPRKERQPLPKECKLKEHFLKSHWDHKIIHEGKAMLKCILPCLTMKAKMLQSRGHWHCCHCSRPFYRRNEMTVHLHTHSRATESAIPRNSATTDRAKHESSRIKGKKELCSQAKLPPVVL
ncbi:uncharacterized protein [Montipora foliosa]|uniref:uncharacterized protein n=1 Tax=Montipora foliosa TaxID=591990 RepID=UPI0035F1D18C